MNSINEAVFLHEFEHGTVVYVNDSMCEMYGVKREEVIGQNIEFLSSGEEPYCKEEAMKHIENAIKNGKEIFEWHARKGSGELFWGEVCINVVNLEGIEYALVTVRDIEERIRYRKKVENINIELEQKVRERTQEQQNLIDDLGVFSYTISHNLKIPLRAINGFSSLVEESAENVISEKSKGYLSGIRRNVKKMDGLLSGIIKYNHVESKRIVPTKCDANRVVKSIVGEYKKNNNNVTFVVDDNLPVVYADRELFDMVFINLIDNAVKFSVKSDIPYIEIGVNDENVFFIKDNGIGIDEKYHSDIFHVFHTLSSEKYYQGYGIGLCLVKKALAKHNGEIWLESKVNEGSTFYFTFT